jgi:hypothetical protein
MLLAAGNGDATFASLLEEIPLPPAVDPTDAEARQIEDLLREVRERLWKAQLSAYVAGQSADLVELHLAARDVLRLPPGVHVHCWPITVHENMRKALADQATMPAKVAFGSVSADALTSFFAFEVHVQREARTGTCRFVFNLPLIGAPADRRERLLRGLLRDREQVLRLLLLLLSDGGLDAQDLLRGIDGGDGSGRRGVFRERQLFESLMRTLEREPARLDDVASLVADLQNNPETSALLPEGFAQIWSPIWTVRERLRGGNQEA